MNTIKTLLIETLKQDTRLWNETELNQTLLLDLVEQIDETIIDLLLQQEELRNKFFVKIRDVYVFKTNNFRFFMEENKINNSYTAYKNRIGLTDGKKFLKDTNDVVLDFPYKDCVLEGGQSNEEGTDTYFEYSEKTDSYEQKQGKRKEVFFNQVLAHDEIDRLFDAKALRNWKRHTKNGQQNVGQIKRDETGTIKENLIIKGNNLLALHSLKREFKGKVKLIYIDPPYNTGNDGFKYNDNFNHSTWLTFMKNRLEVAKELLRDDGVIFVQCDDNEQAYLKVLMDEIFGRENFVGTLIHQRAKGGGQAKYIVKGHDYITIYAKKLTTNSKFIREKVIQGKVIEKNGKEYLRNDDVVRKVFGKYDKSLGDRRCFYEELSQYKNEKQVIEIQEKIDKGVFVLEKFSEGKSVICEYKLVENSYSKLYSIFKALSEDGNIEIENLGLNFSNPKPEAVLEFIINSCTIKNDIVLDFHLGSGTTCAVAHKMGRQYIGVEQMDYVQTISVERLKKVIAGEQGGISKNVNWQGGGDFVYFELAKWNQTAKEKIIACENLEQLVVLFDQMYEQYFLNYNFKIREFKEKVIKEAEFVALGLEQQKQMFVLMLDNNQMYVNKTEMADTKFGINAEDQDLTSQFYNQK